MIRNVLILMVFILFSVAQSAAQKVTIYGVAPEYAGYELAFYFVANPFSNNEITLVKSNVADNGNFKLSFQCCDTHLIFINLGVWRVRLYVEPDFSYEVELPPRFDKTPEEEESPFFKMENLYMKLLTVKDNNGQIVTPEKELNYRIINFDAYFNSLYDQLAVDAAKKCPVSWLDSTINSYIETLPKTGNKYFDDYSFYNSGLLYIAANRNIVYDIPLIYFADKPVLYNNIAYMELFNAVYDKHFRTKNYDLSDIINQEGSYGGLKRELRKNEVLANDELCELVILKNIHDEFYQNQFSRGALIHILDSAKIHSKVVRNNEIAGEIRSKITKMLAGFEPPDFSLYKHDSILVNLQSYRGKYVYLMFCSTQKNNCISQFELLERLYKTHHKWLDIVVIAVDDNFADMQRYKKESAYPWDFLHYANDPEIIKKYDVRIFPTSFLINPEGKLALSPAPVPAPIYQPGIDGLNVVERALWNELNSKGLWREYVNKGLITIINN